MTEWVSETWVSDLLIFSKCEYWRAGIHEQIFSSFLVKFFEILDYILQCQNMPKGPANCLKLAKKLTKNEEKLIITMILGIQSITSSLNRIGHHIK